MSVLSDVSLAVFPVRIPSQSTGSVDDKKKNTFLVVFAVGDVLALRERSGNPNPYSRGGETGGTGGDRSPPPGPRNFISWEGPTGTRYFLKWALLTVILLFLGSLLFLHTPCGPFWRFGALLRKGPQGLVPHLGTHLSRPDIQQSVQGRVIWTLDSPISRKSHMT